MNFRMNDLHHFVIAAKYKTLKEASQIIGITPPSLSESIKRLETDLHSTLFYRSRSGISLTPSGKKLYEISGKIFSAFGEIDSELGNQEHYKNRSITIGSHSMIASYFLPNALKELQQSNSNLKINIVHGLSRQIQTDIQMGKIDVGIVVNPSPMPDLIIRKIATETVAVWGVRKKAQYQNVICDPNLFQVQSILRKWKFCPPGQITSSNLELITRLTAQGIGCGILPSRAVSLLKVSLERIPHTPIFTDSICLVYRPEFNKSKFEKFILEILKKNIQ